MTYRPSFRMTTSVAFAILLVGSWTVGATENNSAFTAAMNSIQAEQLQGHVDYLADDERAGREAGTPGGRASGDYLIEYLKELGLKGGGTDGCFEQDFGSRYRNILAQLDGRDEELAGGIVVICAHYDHVGRGSRKTSLGKIGQIHNGADDNASGTSAILEIAEAFSYLPEPPRRTVLFAFWDAEEKGLLGSKHWVSNPTVRRDRIVAAINLDMIGRLRDNQLTMFGSRSGLGYRRLVAMNNRQSDLRVDFPWPVVANSDHHPFFRRQIPVLFAHTGVHDQYHRETDDADLINSDGIARVAKLLFGVAHDLADEPDVRNFRMASRTERAPKDAEPVEQVGMLPYRLGATWDIDPSDGQGVELSAITPGAAADSAGIRPGDRVLEMAGRTIRSGEDLADVVVSATNPVRVVVIPREGEEAREVTLELDGKPLRLGITWELDAAEPGTVILKQIISGSAAARAGLKPGDRVYQVAGRDFANDDQFTEWVTILPGPLELLVEREGRLVTIVVHFGENGA